MMKPKSKAIVGACTLFGILILLMVLFPQSLGLGATGFDTDFILTQFFFYVTPGVGFLIGILAFFFVELLIVKGDDKYGSGVGFVQSGEKPSLPFLKRVSQFQLALLSFVIFGIMGLVSFAVKPQTSFTGLFVLEQQFTPIASILFSAFLIPIAENAGAGFLIAFCLFGLRRIARRTKMSSGSFTIISYVAIPLLVGAVGFFNHILRYQGSEISQLIVFLFWTMGGLITVLTGSFIPFFAMHLMNNLFYDIARFFSSDTIYFAVGGAIVGLLVLYFVIYGFKFGVKKRGK